MTTIDDQAGQAQPRRASPAPLRLLSCIRLDEVCVLQGAPVMGALFAIDSLSLALLLPFALLVAGNLCLVGHVFVLNDWAGIATDARDPRRAADTFVARGTAAAEMAGLALGLLAMALALLGALGTGAFVIGLLIALLSAAYSLGGKGVPVFNSLLHLAGGALHFLLGTVAFTAISWPALAVSTFFGLVFAAGHFTHEARDHDGDRDNGIRTNAVAFGRQRGFFAGLVLFAASYGLLMMLALRGEVPAVLGAAALVAGTLHAAAALRAFRADLTFEALRRLQGVYRVLHAIIGLTMLATVPPW